MRIAVVGGGPGGLFFATLAKRADPTREITVFERNRADDTFGFGVVFSDATLEGIHRADPVLRTALDDHGVHWDPIEVRLHGERFWCHGNGMAAVSRRTLLDLLQRQALDAGVEVRFSTTVDVEEIVAAGFDLVVAADGANSRIRERYSDAFGPTSEQAVDKFIWLGTTYPFAGLTFVHERSRHGVFAVHGYPIGDGRSTFIVETDEASWRAAGLDEFDTSRPPGPSDEKTRAYLETLFAEQIDGHPVLVNNSRWDNFRTRRSARWVHRTTGAPVVLLGDAAHTAHFSVGSGTKMAMEDAVALAAALDDGGDLDAYEASRRPEVAKIQDSARPSLSWWEHFGRSHDHLPPWQFAYHFFTRSLREGKLRRRDAAFVDDTHDRWRSEHGDEPLTTPLRSDTIDSPSRVVASVDNQIVVNGNTVPVLPVEAPAGEEGLPAVLDPLRSRGAGAPAVVLVSGGTSFTRRLVCEAARHELGLVTVLHDDGDPETAVDVAVTAVLSGRTDLVTGPALEVR